MHSVPIEIIDSILQYIPYIPNQSIPLVCKQWYNIYKKSHKDKAIAYIVKSDCCFVQRISDHILRYSMVNDKGYYIINALKQTLIVHHLATFTVYDSESVYLGLFL